MIAIKSKYPILDNRLSICMEVPGMRPVERLRKNIEKNSAAGLRHFTSWGRDDLEPSKIKEGPKSNPTQ